MLQSMQGSRFLVFCIRDSKKLELFVLSWVKDLTWIQRAVGKGLRWQLACCLRGPGSSCPPQLPRQRPLLGSAAGRPQSTLHSCVPESRQPWAVWQLQYKQTSAAESCYGLVFDK